MRCKSLAPRFVFGFLAIVCALSITLWMGCDEVSDTPSGPETTQETIIPSAPPGDVMQAVMAIQNRHTANLMADPNVVGTATGLTAGGTPAILVLAKSAPARAIPDRIEGVLLIVKITGEIRALDHKPNHNPGGPGGGGEDPVDPTARFDHPVPIGVSTGHPAITAGTIGCRVTDGTDVYALSNNHVYADENSASIGDAVIQPGTFDGGSSPADDIGTLFDFEPIVFSISASNIIDAAIALSSTGNLGNATPSDGYGTPKSTTIAASVNLKVKKYGRTTSQTKGQVFAINATVDVGYDSGVARFVNQIIITPGSFSNPGDSGSLIVVDGKGKTKKDDRKPVGVLFAGSPSITVANPIGPVLTRFGVTVDGE